MRQAMPLDKTPQFNNISDWTIFKKKLITEFGDIPIFAREAHSVFNLIPVYESVQELAEDLAPKIKNLESIIECMKEYHSIETLYNALLTPDLNTNVIRSLPSSSVSPSMTSTLRSTTFAALLCSNSSTSTWKI